MHSLLHIKRATLEDEHMKCKHKWQHDTKLGGIHLIWQRGKIVLIIVYFLVTHTCFCKKKHRPFCTLRENLEGKLIRVTHTHTNLTMSSFHMSHMLYTHVYFFGGGGGGEGAKECTHQAQNLRIPP